MAAQDGVASPCAIGNWSKTFGELHRRMAHRFCRSEARERARRRAFYGRVAARLRRECSRLLAFEEVVKGHLAHNRRRLGLREVEISKIVGSVGRTAGFDRGFMPTKASLRERWKRVDRAFHRGLDLPAVRLFKMGDFYFVEDGNHRVSVARYHRVETIEAEVTEFCPLYLARSVRAA